jgi:succinate dehydrogenase / fumarate reductase cytochrome b subunit
MKSKQKRPKFLNLLKIHLPVTGVNSFAHRVSGALMFVAIPGLIYIFGLSLRDSQSYTKAIALLQTIPVKLILTVLAWSLGHHLLAGIRFLLFDASIGAELPTAKASAWAVNIAGVVVFLVLAYKVWL